MTREGLRHDVQQALRIVWLVIAAFSGIIVLAPFLLSSESLSGIFPICAAKAAGSSCMLCGMTTAFVSIGQQDWARAYEANAGAIPLYAVLLANFVGAAMYTMMRVLRHAHT